MRILGKKHLLKSLRKTGDANACINLIQNKK
nr:MAG TPA: hypothetical protein [Caudoviricetes sp.]